MAPGRNFDRSFIPRILMRCHSTKWNLCTFLHWDPTPGPATATATVAESQLCIINVRRRAIELFDRYGVMQIDAVALPQ
jgi:hypothetical protein